MRFVTSLLVSTRNVWREGDRSIHVRTGFPGSGMEAFVFYVFKYFLYRLLVSIGYNVTDVEGGTSLPRLVTDGLQLLGFFLLWSTTPGTLLALFLFQGENINPSRFLISP